MCIKNDDYYSFNVHDGSYVTVLFEIPALFDEKEKFMTSMFKDFQAEKCSVVNELLCAKRYIEKKYSGCPKLSLYEVYQQNEQRILTNPDNI